ncbi:hypothetical protein SAMN04244559_03360 [Magnetospirillum fulvum]|uniref:Uncharacterized protein n=1 Tax=Magnetospirillum fulvum TaxID=1082 RepID=A0A1H6K431_MAGFU|nr:hypothetical protein SAMN04244559_03360 [Magnetospirillum fulvum]
MPGAAPDTAVSGEMGHRMHKLMLLSHVNLIAFGLQTHQVQATSYRYLQN